MAFSDRLQAQATEKLTPSPPQGSRGICWPQMQREAGDLWEHLQPG